MGKTLYINPSAPLGGDGSSLAKAMGSLSMALGSRKPRKAKMKLSDAIMCSKYLLRTDTGTAEPMEDSGLWLTTGACKRTIVVDTHNLAWKCYYGKFYRTLTIQRGGERVISGHIYGAFTKINALIRELCAKPHIKTALVIVADENHVRATKLFPEYKANRGEHEYSPVPDVLELLSTFPHILVSNPTKTEEADSIIATYVVKNPLKQHFVLSSDRDMWQLWGKATLMDSASRKFTDEDYTSKFGATLPHRIPLFKAIFGDSSDNIPRILPDSAQSDVIPILNKIAKPSDIFDARGLAFIYQSKLLKKRKQLRRMYKVARLRTDCKVEITRSAGDFGAMKKILEKWQCRSLASKVTQLQTMLKMG